MSTRSVIAEVSDQDPESWRGVYCHFDGYPTNLGALIWEILHTRFLGNSGVPGVENNADPHNAVRAFCSIFIDGHPGGWSVLDEKCYCHDEYFVMRDGVHDCTMSRESLGSSIEWVYVLDPQTLTMTIDALRLEERNREAYPEPVTKDGTIDYGYCVCRWEQVAEVDLLDGEPDWEAIEKS